MRRKIIEKLVEWKNNFNRMPLIIKGARQVGKTYIIKEFGKRYYENIVYVNLETNSSVTSYFDGDISPKRIIAYLESMAAERILPGKTLIVFDEIQSCERALTSLKYFCEDAPEYHVIAAGSLLGVAVNRSKYSYPVGKVDTLIMYPLDFEEFLWALNKEKLAEIVREHYNSDQRLPEALHNEATDLYKKYLIIGGMPAVIADYILSGSILTVVDVQNRILNEYIADMAKYASKTASVKIRSCYNSIPAQLAKENRKFQYKVVQKGGTATIFGESIEWLDFAGIILKCNLTAQGKMPIAVYQDFSDFKIYMSDIGLLTLKSGIAQQAVLSPGEINNAFLGALTENYAAQALSTNGHPLFYWKDEGKAEVDFVLQRGAEITPIEVKAGENVRSKSLGVFIKRYNIKYAIRISAKNFGFENGIKSVPLYAAFCI